MLRDRVEAQAQHRLWFPEPQELEPHVALRGVAAEGANAACPKPAVTVYYGG